MIKAIFYARFHPEKGPIIAHQVPPSSIVNTTPSGTYANTAASASASGSVSGEHSPPPPPVPVPRSRSNPPSPAVRQHAASLAESAGPSNPTTTAGANGTARTDANKPLLDFPLLSPYLIPPQSLCNRLLTLRSPTTPHLILSHPVCIVDDERYERNEFIFNFGIVVDDSGEGDGPAKRRRHGLVEAYKGVVRKVAGVLRDLEVEKGWLAKDERDDEVRRQGRGRGRTGEGWDEGSSKVYALCEMVLEDLNCYGECMIPIDETTTLSLRLNPVPPPAPRVSAWHVPVLLIAPEALHTTTWDLTLQMLLPFIDGVASVSRIAALADADVSLACEAVRQLVHYGCAILLDVFSFGASYAATPEIGELLIRDKETQEEGRRYVSYPGMEDQVSEERLVTLLRSLRQGVRLKEWCLENAEELEGIDVRRLVTFGVIKGFLYRVHKYAIATPLPVPDADLTDVSRESQGEETPEKDEVSKRLARYLDGQHCFDQICTEMQMSDKDIMAALKGQDVQIIYR